jgi:hypothetical protein
MNESAITETAINVEEAWERFQKQYTPGAKKAAAPTDGEEFIAPKFSSQRRRYTFWLRTASIAATLCMVILCFTVPSASGTENMFTAIGQWTSQLFTFKYDGFRYFSDNLDLVKLKELADTIFHVDNIVPSWLPDGFKMKHFNIFGSSAESSISATFSSDEHDILYSATHASNHVTTCYEKDDSEADA